MGAARGEDGCEDDESRRVESALARVCAWHEFPTVLNLEKET